MTDALKNVTLKSDVFIFIMPQVKKCDTIFKVETVVN